MNEISPIFDQSFQSLEQAMKVATLRQSVIAHNIANANTPGYVPQSFDEELMKAVKRQDKKQVVINVFKIDCYAIDCVARQEVR